MIRADEGQHSQQLSKNPDTSDYQGLQLWLFATYSQLHINVILLQANSTRVFFNSNIVPVMLNWCENYLLTLCKTAAEISIENQTFHHILALQPKRKKKKKRRVWVQQTVSKKTQHFSCGINLPTDCLRPWSAV